MSEPEKKLGSKSEMEAAEKLAAEKPSAMRQFQTLIQAVWPGAGGSLTLEEVIRKAVEHRQGYAFANEQLSMVTKAVTGGPLNTKQAMDTAARWREAEARGAQPPPESHQELKRENERLKKIELKGNALYTKLRNGEMPEDDGTGITFEIRRLLAIANAPSPNASKCPADGIVEMPSGEKICMFDLLAKVEGLEKTHSDETHAVGTIAAIIGQPDISAIDLIGAVRALKESAGDGPGAQLGKTQLEDALKAIGALVGAAPEAGIPEVIAFVEKLANHAIKQNQKLIELESVPQEPAEVIQARLHKITELEARIKSLEDEITTWRTGSEESSALIHDLRAGEHKLTEERDNLAADLEKVQTENDELQQKLSTAQKQLAAEKATRKGGPR